MSNKFNYIEYCENIQPDSQKPHFYKITNLINGKYYYGVHDGSDTENYEGSGLLLNKAYEKYGIQNFKKQILKEFETEDEAYEYEAMIVDEEMIHENNPMCYNLCKGGHGGDINSGTIVINKNGKQKHIKPLDLNQYLEKGWELGFTKQNIQKMAKDRKGKILINDGIIHKRIKNEKLDYWLKLGWKKGQIESINERIGQSHLNKVPITNGIEQKWKMVENEIIPEGFWIGFSENHLKMLKAQGLNFGLKNKDKIGITDGKQTKKVFEFEFIEIWSKLGWKKGIDEKSAQKFSSQLNSKYFKCPYNEMITNSGCMTSYIRRHYPNEKQWDAFTKQEKESYRVISPVIDVD
jgi:hypothetical protein